MSNLKRLALIFVVLLTACSPGGTASPEPSGSAGATYSIEQQWEYVLGLLADPAGADTAEIAQRFGPDFLAKVSPDDLVSVLESIQGDYAVEATDVDTALKRTGTIRGGGTRLAFSIAIDPATGRITGLLFQPAGPDPAAGPVAPSDADAALAAVAPMSGWAAYDVTDGTCAPLHEDGAQRTYAMGSEFKLWILAAIIEDVNSGRLSWSDSVVVQDALKSTPDGEVYAKANGTTMRVDELAKLMISVSDNSAADLLLNKVGRDRALRAMRDAGVADPERNDPFLSTRELFLLKLAPANAGWEALTVAERTAYLDNTVAGQSLSDVNEADVPAAPWAIESLEWFASPEDMCHTWLRIEDLIAVSTPADAGVAEDVLTANPGLEFDTARWPEIWYKGGSEPGVYAMTWRLAGADGREYVLAAFLNDPKHDFPEIQAISAMQTVQAAFETLVVSG